MPAVDPGRTRVGRRVVLGLLGTVAVALIWASCDAVLAGMGQLLVSEDPVAPVDVIVLSQASGVGNALEVARLYREGYGAEIVTPSFQPDPLASAVRDLGIPFLGEGDLVSEILARGGVPSAAVRVLPGFVDGTDTEVAAVGEFARKRQPSSLLFVTARSHTARARWMLRRALPATTRLLVCAPRTDQFHADAWWRSRADIREVFMEWTRWLNTSILGDPWARTTGPA